MSIDLEAIRARAEAATPIPEFPGYEVDENGQIWSSLNWRGCGRRKIVPVEGKSGYLKVRLTLPNGKRVNRYVHRIVAETLLGPRPNGLQVRHLDGDKTNNCVSNLAWGTAKENADDRERCGTTARGERDGFSKLRQRDISEIRMLSHMGFTQQNIAKRFNVNQTTIGRVVRNESWKSA